MERELALALLLRRADRRVAGRLSAVLASRGGSLEQWHVLSCLSGGNGMAMSEISAMLMLPPPSMTKLVDGMVAENLVHRRADAGDRRRVLVFLTPRGRRVHRELHRAVQQDEVELQALHGAEDLDLLIAHLVGLVASLDCERAAPVDVPSSH